MHWLVASVALGVSVPVLAEALGPEVTPFAVVDAPASFSAASGSSTAPAARPGTIAPGRRTDLVLVKGAPSRAFADIENVEVMFQGAWATTRGSSSNRSADRWACADRPGGPFSG